MTQRDLLEVEPPSIPEGSLAMVRHLDLPPGDPGIAPHRHSGPVFGFMLEGEMLFELEGGAPYPVKAGEAFWEPGGDVIHYTVSNLLADSWSRFVVTMFCPPGVEMITYVDDEELAAKRPGRVSSADPSAPAGWPSRPATRT
ncbi:Cupin domain-containing protein [Asanoa ishikariensis]|uniref:Cupin domain-containing protein n=1 Tax=Asanoa ishikariensis TaxID=137265 RepID=A0A1H3UMV1_9ACTN|nr:cupin domain-containing protein [Asanoa ishikariensis]SDZ63687.1 Cupin domain-containing protein [Asanoa ishikariensis]